MKITVIIPVYNVAEFIERAIMSVVTAMAAAKFDVSCEVICVDDGGTDGSGKLLDEIAARQYDRMEIKVVHQENKGVGASRNLALDMATGDYVVFLDGDDLVSPKIFNIMSEAVAKFGTVDFISWGHSEFIEDADAFPVSKLDSVEQFNYIDISARISSQVYRILFWECAYNRGLIGGQRFEKLIVGEDRTFLLSLLDRAKSVVSTNAICYGYRQRMNSAVHTPITLRKFIDDLHHYRLTFERIKNSPKEYDDSLARSFGLVLTEYKSSVFFAMCRDDRGEAWNNWMITLKSALSNISISYWSQMVMRLLVASDSRFLAWVLCYVPYWLKSHGFNRKFAIVKK